MPSKLREISNINSKKWYRIAYLTTDAVIKPNDSNLPKTKWKTEINIELIVNDNLQFHISKTAIIEITP